MNVTSSSLIISNFSRNTNWSFFSSSFKCLRMFTILFASEIVSEDPLREAFDTPSAVSSRMFLAVFSCILMNFFKNLSKRSFWDYFFKNSFLNFSRKSWETEEFVKVILDECSSKFIQEFLEEFMEKILEKLLKEFLKGLLEQLLQELLKKLITKNSVDFWRKF